ncbi:hypothetical protein N9Y92_01455 [Chlamydiales bacterium]|nr:hypothetical protein [Chlamydiales bacterium]
MKHFLFLLFLSSQLVAVDHLILHFDINNTLIAEDRLGNKSQSDVVNYHLARKYTYLWDDTLVEPISYATYVYNHLVPGGQKDQHLKSLRKKHLDQFIPFLEKTNHPLHKEISENFEMIQQKLQTNPSFIFTSFYKLLDALNIPYTLHLRSYGNDHQIVIDEIERTQGKTFFTEVIHFKKGILHTSDGVFSTPHEIYQILLKNQAIKDDWLHWHSHGETERFGKPFYIDQENLDIVELFFDDHVDDEIVNCRDAKTGKPLKLRNAFNVDTLAAIADDDYFINLIKNLALTPADKLFTIDSI